tara:strand:+ start:7764 stop:8168 length:405 start_codon:yes stop_codon:yes gene_type:complete
MSEFETVVQTEIYSILANDAGLNAVVTGVYDSVPQVSSTFPYVTIGEDIFTDMSTDTELINLVSITIHVWSRHSGRSETKRIQGLIYGLLNRANITNASYKFININQVTSQTQMDSDGETRHGIQTFNLILEEL